uniref:F-box domain-containing protein n=1 Tax=Globodera pallida TaxID=36090 RepID=A0A183BNE2_GLOPA
MATELNVSDKVWLDILMWLERAEVGTKFALINARFNSLVDVQLTQRKWPIEKLQIQRAANGNGAEICIPTDGANFKFLPLASTPLPDCVIGLNSLTIRYIDQSVVTFLFIIRRLFSSNIALKLSIKVTEHNSWRVMAKYIWPLLQNSINALLDMKKSDFAMMHKYISPTVLFNCVNLRRIYSQMYPQSPEDDVDEPLPGGRDLFAWLHTPRTDGDALFLKLVKWKAEWHQMSRRLAQTFNEALLPVNFVIGVSAPFSYNERFHVANGLTMEQLSQTTHSDNPMLDTAIVLLRGPISLDAQRYGQWMKAANEEFKLLISIEFGDADIGPLPSVSSAHK